jgi:hypothetical protein
MAFNGETVLIEQGDDMVQIEPIAEEVVPGKIYSAADFYE